MDGESTGAGLELVYALVDVFLAYWAPIGCILIVLVCIREIGSFR